MTNRENLDPSFIPDYLLLEENRQLYDNAERASIQYGPFSYQKKEKKFYKYSSKIQQV